MQSHRNEHGIHTQFFAFVATHSSHMIQVHAFVPVGVSMYLTVCFSSQCPVIITIEMSFT